ncbi:M48 family metallopeptidase [Cesiribacter sp. SM1]|uniref:M48 family metallopeptidase n=1 Tax=Cesiribacter sp. SM1 TaxID=2861196 RepID=UPI001CD6A9B9|nr:M48 family metallopeptidase [Cesiribacter sp. SM1]
MSLSPNALKLLLVGLVSFGYLLELLLDWLNYTYLKKPYLPQLSGILTEEKYHQSVAYQQERKRFGFITATYSFLLMLVMLLSGGFGWLDDQLRAWTQHPILLALLYFGVLMLASDLLSLPFQLYSTFKIEERWGFNKTNARTFWLDKLKGYALGALLGGLLLSLLLWLVLQLGQNFWLYFWGVLLLFMLGANVFYTSLILPLFNKLRPLTEGALKTALETYSQKINFPLKNIYVIDGSKRSSKANAFFAGLGKQKKIVLYDTLIEKHTEEEIVAVLAHEAGHYKKQHILKGFVLSVLQSGLMLFLLSRFIGSETLTLALGSTPLGGTPLGGNPLEGGLLPLHLNLIGFGLLYSPISMLLGLLMNSLSRRHEYQADAYAAQTYGARPLQEALRKLSVLNLSQPLPHPWYVWVHYSHPPLLYRLEALEKQKQV